MELPRLNSVIRAWESGKPAFATFSPAHRQASIDLAGAPYDSVVFEMEHNGWDPVGLQDSLQYLLNRRQIATSASLGPRVTPMVRIPPNGCEMNQSFAKQALDRGVYGIVFPHITCVEEARNAVAACRYPSLPGTERHEPRGLRGDGPTTCARYWGLTQQEYYTKSDVWPLNPAGEILVFLMIESVRGIDNLDDILKYVPGIGCIIVGEGDLSQELGIPRQYENPLLKAQMERVLATAKKYDVPVGHPHVTSKNVEQVLADGYRFLMSVPLKTYAAIEKGREISGAPLSK
jgi:4-hydroxy-2-oxoheptanedioate aldolase